MQQICFSQSFSTGAGTNSSTTTVELRQSNTQWNKIRGYSVEILKLLNDCGGLSTIEIANRIDKTPKYTSNYLYRLRKYGLIDLNKNNWKWYITALDDIIIYIIFKDNRTTTQQQHKDNENDNVSSLYKNGKMVSEEPKKKTIDEWIQGHSQMEIVVVPYLFKHFQETMNKYVLCTSHDELAEMLNIPFPESAEIPKTLIKLESEGVLYNYYVREKSAWKIGLKEAFINRMKFC